ncbi:hypothetical protein GUITHDRAFT_139678 [Guillardia theta CCMP2712]|uniref:Uncharacterized protein n=1 Tax=Guillardia theta (strain CCMP2712) TaxID=905079 RepID=L1J7A9_GUITC|nr:hypothetical protein GUITHDRAFT_139678 [Guillardia theta CCMP2712]EKX44423.1 hypothetical protein GUITHDRAFT_139678 [Guillardia theta CCMP2712]|eukprot:XP_005831403.1 hypothetical protein GUITHDRAFT_139678 [Guillardia theta CCMP2712]
MAIDTSAKALVSSISMHLLKHGAKMSAAQVSQLIQSWQKNPIMLEVAKSRTQMLAPAAPAHKSELEGESSLCTKQDVIIQKLDQLLKKLGGEELSLNITLGKVQEEWKDALDSWLSAEANYRLRVEQKKEADEGMKYAQDQYEKYRTADKEAVAHYQHMAEKHAQERQGLDDEEALIREIMRMIGVLHDVNATDRSIAAGGRDSIKDSETGVSDPYGKYLSKTKAQLMAKINQLKQLAKQTGLSSTSLARITTLPVYSETEEVAKILREMLEDIASRRKVLDESEAQALKLKEDTHAKLIEWEMKLTDLGKQKDKAKESYEAEQLKREKLSGNEKILEIKQKDATEDAKKLIPPYEREIYVITMIKMKIVDHCKNQPTDNASGN